MINFASLFGSFSRGGNSLINDLLDKPDTTLEQLLDIESFPNEYKSGNNKILEYMKYPKYQGLINYVTVEGPADNQKKGYKFPMVAADVLAVENSAAIDYFLPDGTIQVEVQYDSTQQYELEVDDDEPQKIEQQPKQEPIKTQSTQTPAPEAQKKKEQDEVPSIKQEQEEQTAAQQQVQEPKPKKKKIIKETRPMKKTRKQARQPLMAQLLSYYEGPINYTLAGYNCKVLNTLFGKKPSNFLKFIFKSKKNYVQLICNHIESKSVGDLVTRILVWENTQFVQERKAFYDHLINLMSKLNQSHSMSNLAGAIYDIIEKTSTYIKSKVNIANNQEIIKSFLDIFYRTSEVHKIVNNAMSEDQTLSGYNCMVLHAYLHHTEIQTFNSFKLEEVLQSFITKASEKLRNFNQKKKVLGMGRVKIVEIFSFLIRKQPKAIDEETAKQTSEMSSQLLEELYVHSMIANVSDFFSILIKLMQFFENNNILHNEIYRILQTILKEPQSNGSALQQLMLNDENVILKFILYEAEQDKKIKSAQKHTRRKGYIGHVINLCKLIDSINDNTLLNEKIKKTPQFQQVLNTMVAVDITETNKSLAGYQMKKNPNHQIMFQKDDILSAYSEFLSRCPKPQFQVQERESSQDEAQQTVAMTDVEPQNIGQKVQQMAEKQLQEQERDEEKFNELAVNTNTETVNSSDPKFWITHINYDVDKLLQDVD